MMNADEITGELVHIAMRRQKVTQAVLGEALGLTQAALGKKLHGNRSWTLDEVLAASRYLDVPMKDLLPGADYNPVLTGRGRHVEPLVEATADYGSEGWGFESLVAHTVLRQYCPGHEFGRGFVVSDGDTGLDDESGFALNEELEFWSIVDAMTAEHEVGGHRG